jgi:hypothetical protein
MPSLRGFSKKSDAQQTNNFLIKGHKGDVVIGGSRAEIA